MMNYPLPKNSSKSWLAHKNRSPQNPSLIFDRFVQNWGQAKDSEAKRKAWEEILETAQKADAVLLSKWNLRWQAIVQSAKAKQFTMKASWRFMAGLGSKGPLEVGFNFHRNGFPILPGSSVKGVARAWGLHLLGECLARTGDLSSLDTVLSIDEEEKFDKSFTLNFPQASDEAISLAKAFRSIFGTPGCSGQSVFFDGIPVRLPKIELDVMNPHYANYYQDQTGEIPPASWLSPVPIYFLTVAKGSEFNFAIGWRTSIDDEIVRNQRLAEEWLKAGLKNLGAGAKTSAGYGYFIEQDGKVVSPPMSLKDHDLSDVYLKQGEADLAVDPDKEKADQIICQIQSVKTSAVAGSIIQYHQIWRDIKINPEQKKRIAEAIVTKVKEAGREKKSLEKEWYRELLSCIEKI